MNKTVYIPTILISTLFFSSMAHAEMYKWTDKHGKTHYTQTPPPADVDSKDIEADIRLSTGKLGNKIPVTDQQDKKGDEMEEARKAGAKSEKKHQEFCAQQKAVLQQMTSNSLIKWKDDEGERYLTAEEKASKIGEITQNINNMCRPEMFKQERNTSEQELAQGKGFKKAGGSIKAGGKAAGNSVVGAAGNDSKGGAAAAIEPLPSAD